MAELLIGVAEGIIQTSGSLDVKLIELWGVRDEIKSLTSTVSTIKAVLLDAEEQQAAGNHAVKGWLGELEDAMYDADDLLDDVSTETLRREIMTRDNNVAEKVRIFLSKSNLLAFRYRMAREIKAIIKKLDAINARARDFHLRVRHVESEIQVWGNRERDNTHGYVCSEAVIGRDDDKKAVMHRLLDSDVEDNVSILPIVGFGGLGKTALAKFIFTDEQIQKHFQLKMWVRVSDSFHVKNIVKKIIEAATKMKSGTDDMRTLVGELKEIIDGNKYFLVLDDVWNEDREKWSRLIQVLIGGASGSKILVTTRSEMVARIMGTVSSYHLTALDEDASWSLFKQMAFEKGHQPEENSSLVAIGRQILAKCSGVPLAIRTIGGLLCFNNSETEWWFFTKNYLSKMSQDEHGALPTLKLSYDHLSSHLKHCFTYCSLFPKDYGFRKSRLIQLWIAQGFVKSSDQNLCLEDVGHEYFMDLLRRSFFQKVETDEFGNLTVCKMHDLIHDLAISEARSLITVIDDMKRHISAKARHVSVVGYNINDSSIAASLYKASSIRTFICPIVDYFVRDNCETIVSSCKLLRVLDLSKRNLEFLPRSVGKLKHLRYLDLCCNVDLKMLPSSITRLINLQTLILSRCIKLKELPRDTNKLVNLRHLEIDDCNALTYMPCELGQLTNLLTLSKFVLHKDPLSRHCSGLKELNRLNNLRGSLDIENLRHGKAAMSECKAANLKEKQHLHALGLQWSIKGGVIASDDIVDDEVLLEVLQPHLNLKRLRLEGNYGSRLPTWLSSLTNLVRFELDDCTKCQYLPPLNQLPSLKVLHLIQMDAMEYISSGSGDSNEFSCFFPSLEELWLNGCPNLKGWWRRRDSSVEVNSDSHNFVDITEHPLLPFFPRLSKLEIYDCPMLTSMPMFPHLEEQLVLWNASLKPLQQTMMMNMAAPQSPTSTATTFSSFTPLSKLKSIELKYIADLGTLPGVQHLTALQDLELDNCPELELANDEDGMQWQGLKSLLSLKFSQLPKMVSLPLGLQHATTLQSLRISYCENLMSLPEGISRLTSLQRLTILACPDLELANDEDGMQFQGLSSLCSLWFSRLPKLVSLPSGLQHATTLQSLKIWDCENLTAIPEWIHNCKSLQLLEICECSSLTSLPEGIRSLTSLQRLKITGCPILLQRCEREVGEDWAKISHIPELKLKYPE